MYGSFFRVVAFGLLNCNVLAAPSVSQPVQRPPGLWPHLAEQGRASRPLVDFIEGYFTAKNLHQPEAWTPYFHPTEGTYGDAGLGNLFSQPELSPVIGTFVNAWGPDSRSYPLRIVGDTNSALLYMIDTPDMFGDELRILVALDFKDGLIVREVDYWDPRRNTAAKANRVPPEQYPSDFASALSSNTTNATLRKVVNQLSSALSKGDYDSAASLLAPDAVLEDFSLRARIDGRLAVEKYLKRAVASLPYGTGSALNHIVGNEKGGAYEWNGTPEAAGRNGITAIELDEGHLITRLTSIWDTFNASNSTMQSLVRLSIEP
uniref:SnoaL-like domain-containing protein n=1 Tax=Bionectria ochroleuca TaxID=29856 RepID=A0A8H7MZE5_BIOOC